MAQVERATSLRGKRYLTNKAVIFSNVETKTIKIGGKDNGDGVLQLYDDTDTLYVNMDKSGIKLSNGAEIIGGSGLKSSMFVQGTVRSKMFIINNDFAPLGIDMLYATGGSPTFTGVYAKSSMIFEFEIPSTFTITSATITLTHIPFKWYASGVLVDTGYVRNLQLYKGSSFSGMYKSYDNDLGNLSEAGITYTIKTNALGASGFTGSNSAMTSVTSVDIKSDIVVGANIFKIESGDALPTGTGTFAQCLSVAQARTGACLGLLTITGYTK